MVRRIWDDVTIQKIREGYFSAVYFNRTKEILLKEKNLQKVTMQIFQKNDNAVLCGIKQVTELLKSGTGYFEGTKWISKWSALEAQALQDGDSIQKGETVMHIIGPYVYFAQLESLYLGILARLTRIATNAHEIVKAARKKQVLFFADRFDYFLNQEADGYAAYIGGITNVCTQAQSNWFGGKPIGTIPHALIAVNNGNTILATEQFKKYFPKNPLVALVDFDNDCVTTAISVAQKFGKALWGIRLDTAENMVDVSLQNMYEKQKEFHGVNSALVGKVRSALDKNGFKNIKIIVSGGFNKDKINWFEKEKAPVDIYAVGSAMFEGKNDFTADIVRVGNTDIAKVGRSFKENKRTRTHR